VLVPIILIAVIFSGLIKVGINYQSAAPIVFIIIVIVLVAFYLIGKRNKDRKASVPSESLKPNIFGANPQARSFLESRGYKIHTIGLQLFEKYKQIQIDWMNFNYDGLKANLTDELYNTYKMDLELLKSKNQRNIMENISLDTTIITNAFEEGGFLTIEMRMSVFQSDYIVDEKGNVLKKASGSGYPCFYDLTFVKKLNSSNELICPGCGYEMTHERTNICPYCHSVVISNNGDFVLSKKTRIDRKV
jgi:hypothetical protein